MSTFAQRLEEALLLRDMKPAELSRLSGLTEGQISAYRKGTYKAKQDGVYKIAKALNVSEAWLMGFDVKIDRMPDNLRCNTFEVNVTDQEQELLSDFRKLNAAGQDAAVGAVKAFTLLEQYQNKKAESA